MKNFGTIFRKDLPYDNIKSHKEPGFEPLFRRCIFQKTTRGVKLNPGLIIFHEVLPVTILHLKIKTYSNKSSHLKVESSFQIFKSSLNDWLVCHCTKLAKFAVI